MTRRLSVSKNSPDTKKFRKYSSEKLKKLQRKDSTYFYNQSTKKEGILLMTNQKLTQKKHIRLARKASKKCVLVR